MGKWNPEKLKNHKGMLGKHHSIDTKIKIAEKITPNSLKNLKLGKEIWKGKHHTQEWKDRHRERMLGNKNPFYGKKHSKESM